MFSVSVLKIFEITGKASVVESLLSKVAREISRTFFNFLKCSSMFREEALQEISRNPLSTRVARFQPYIQAYSLNSKPKILKAL